MFGVSIDYKVTDNGQQKSEFSLHTDADGNISFQDLMRYCKEFLILTTDQVVKEEQEKGFDPNPIYVVDNVRNKAVSDVNPFGKIDVIARTDSYSILLDAMAGIISRSPVLTGNYEEHNVVFYNGVSVASSLETLTSWLETKPTFSDKDILRIVNIVPYARRLERLGVTIDRQQSRTIKSRYKKDAARGIRVSAPNGTYYLTYRSLLSKYKNNSAIRFGFITGSAIGIHDAVFKTMGLRRTKKRSGVGRTYLYPTITISLNNAGLTDVV